ncbi:diacylglycerol kinase [Acidovorax sp. GBBC 3334]|uniref:diacylglycerol kinase n=1 Tax=Acidovorax sp. GBBC 3334 TaxID=2940496 RepID=UPI00230201D3|nr:diacylglycerol kinase [Acidovorax sp. GBBC 3334]MDA8453327.1 diacylglycerol kinase [Acidovorax sp. GBBC 3334]
MTEPIFNNPHKSRRGLHRLRHAAAHSWNGLAAGWSEKAFRLEATLAAVLLPLSAWVGRNWLEMALLIATVVLVLVTELLNSAVEAAIDRIGPEWHALSKRAKDMGSAAVLLSLLLCAGVWGAALFQRFSG